MPEIKHRMAVTRKELSQNDQTSRNKKKKMAKITAIPRRSGQKPRSSGQSQQARRTSVSSAPQSRGKQRRNKREYHQKKVKLAKEEGLDGSDSSLRRTKRACN